MVKGPITTQRIKTQLEATLRDVKGQVEAKDLKGRRESPRKQAWYLISNIVDNSQRRNIEKRKLKIFAHMNSQGG